VKLMLRAMYLVALFSPCLIMGAFVEENSHFRTLWMHMLLRTLELAGPAFIKWGQWASTRPDIFPVDICDELAKLHMQVGCRFLLSTCLLWSSKPPKLANYMIASSSGGLDKVTATSS
jgi:hypothetical protein